MSGGDSSSGAGDDAFERLLKEATRTREAPSTPAPLRPGDVLVSGRLEIVKRVASGGMGVVYEAFDRDRGELVALKTLSRLDASSIYHFKLEFRSIADIVHPNLVRLHDLFVSDGQWLLTMELVHGEPFDRWVRPSGVLAAERIRPALAQLAEAIGAIHAAGKLHRDLKPSNVLVEDGRVVVLDFGLASDPNAGGVGQTVTEDSMAGTPAYMAPEQLARQPATASSDWYALGGMLFEVLTGELPFEGRAGQIRAAKLTQDAPSARDAGAPAGFEDLCTLCALLLARRPEARPASAEIQRLLGTGTAPPVSAVTPREPGVAAVERGQELTMLHEAFGVAARGRPIVLVLTGPSGVGKTALLDHFASELRAAGRALVLTGRCHEHESVPYKAFDAAVDALSRHLRRLPDAEARALVPNEIATLAALFPALGRVTCVAEALSAPAPPTGDPVATGAATFAELLRRVGANGPVAVCVDDAHCSDEASVAFLVATLGQPEPPRLLFLCVHRTNDDEDERAVERLGAIFGGRPGIEFRRLDVAPRRHAGA